MMEGLHGDRPISHPSDDVFGLSSFAEALATSLLQMNPRDGLVISVEGPWGAGKSSAIALALRSIKIQLLEAQGDQRTELELLSDTQLDVRWALVAKSQTTHIVRFNPWNFSGQENLVRAFFRELAQQIEAGSNGKVRQGLSRLASYMPSIFGGLAGAGTLAVGHLPAAAVASAVGRAAGEVADKAFKSDTSLERARQNLAEALRQSGHRIIVVIDDVDRLVPSEMRSMLSLVKSLGDLPNVLYVVAFDEEIVRSALTEGVEKIDPDFLGKIVQVSLKLPPPWRSELRQLLFTQLEPILGDEKPPDLQRWQRMFGGIFPYLETPRDVVRLANTLRVIWPTVKGDVDVADLIALTTLQLFDPGVYARIRDDIELITHAEYVHEEDEEFGKRMAPASARKPEAAKKLMELLFPRLAKVWKAFWIESTPYITQKQQRRVCTKEYHRNYFVFGRDARMLSREEVEAVVDGDDPQAAFAATLKRLAEDPVPRQPSRTATFLHQIAEAVYSKPTLTPALLRALLDQSDYLIKREDEAWEFFVVRNEERLKNIIRLGLQKLDQPQREELLDILVNYPVGLHLRAEVIEGEARRNGLFGAQKEHEADRLFPEERIKKAAVEIRDQIADTCESGAVWQAPDASSLIWSWKRMEGGDRLQEWLKGVLADDKLILCLAPTLLSRSYQTGGNHGTRILWVFRRGDWAKILDVDELYARLEALASTIDEADVTLRRLREGEAAPEDY